MSDLDRTADQLTLASTLTGSEAMAGVQSDLDVRITPALLRAFARAGLAITDVTGLQTALDSKQAAGSYATTSALTSGLSGKADASTVSALSASLSGYVTSGALATALGDYYTSAQIDDLLDGVGGGGGLTLVTENTGTEKVTVAGDLLFDADGTRQIGGAASGRPVVIAYAFGSSGNPAAGNFTWATGAHGLVFQPGYFDLGGSVMFRFSPSDPNSDPPDVSMGRAMAGHFAVTDSGLGGVPVGHCLVGKSSTTAGREMARASAEWIDDTDATRTAVYHVSLTENADDVAERFRIDHGAGSGSTGLWLWDADTGEMARVLVSADEQAPSGKRALYLN